MGKHEETEVDETTTTTTLETVEETTHFEDIFAATAPSVDRNESVSFGDLDISSVVKNMVDNFSHNVNQNTGVLFTLLLIVLVGEFT